MSNEEFEKRMEFLVEHQAQFTVDIQQLREAQSRTEEVVVQTGEIVARLATVTLDGFKDVLEGFQDVNAKINALVDAQIKTDEKVNALADSQGHTDEKIDLLVDSQMRTDEVLRNLMAVVDRHLSEGRNGN